MIGHHAIPSLLLLLSNVSLVSGITIEQVNIQMAKNTNRREFIRRMDAAAVIGGDDEIPTRDETTKKYNQELLSKATTHSSLRGEEIVPHSRRLGDDDDDAYYNWNALEVDIAEYSLKYHKCTTMKLLPSGNDNNNNNDYSNSDPFTAMTFVTFRLCPTDSCSADGWSGCRSTYGEYMMELTTFLASQIQYDEEIFEQYCNYCETCMYFENYFYGNNRNLNTHACKYYDDCSVYEDVCFQNDDDDNDNDDGVTSLTYEDLYQCIPIDDVVDDDDDGGNGQQYYLGLACDTDLEMAIYSDDACTKLLGMGDAVYNITGQELSVSEDVLGSFLTQDCISCRESDRPYKISYSDENDGDDILEVCEDVYLSSARCDERLWEHEYSTAGEKDNADATCDYIENLIKGNINEYGQNMNDIESDNAFTVWFNNHVRPDETVVVSQDEVAYLTMGILGCMVMLAYVSYFKKQIYKQQNPLLDVEAYPCDSREYPASGDSTYTSYGSSPPTSPTSTKGSYDTNRNVDPVAAARSID